MTENAIKANRAGLSLTAGVSSTSGELPEDSKGRSPSAIRVALVPGAAIHLRVGASNVSVTASDLLLTGGNTVIIESSGMTHIAVIQAGLSLGGLVQVMPYE